MIKDRSPKETGISSLSGKTVTIRHAAESDMPLIKEILEQYNLDTDDLDHSQFVLAVENGTIIGFGRLRKIDDVYDIGCITVVEHHRNRGIGRTLVQHLIEYAPVRMVYVMSDQVVYFDKLGFTPVQDVPRELVPALTFECNVKGRPATVLMAHEKKDH